MDRHSLTVRQSTKIAQKLPAALEEKIESFHRFIIKHRKQHSYDLSQIGNMDETPMTFDLPPNRTFNPSGHEKTRFTVVLACMADGTKLRPVVIFKHKSLPKNFKFVPGVIVQAHPKGWMDEAGTQQWLRQVWNTRPGAMISKCSMLAWNMFRARHQIMQEDYTRYANGYGRYSGWLDIRPPTVRRLSKQAIQRPPAEEMD